MTDLVFLDTETTGLDPELHEIWEIAWAVNDEIPVQERIMPHSLLTADPKALELNHYWDRANLGYEPRWGENYDLEIKQILTGNTIVAANPAFDASFLRMRWGSAPWHYRMIDVESMALGVLGYYRPKGLADIADDLRELGYNIGEPSHAAWVDVVVLRESYKALRHIMQDPWVRRDAEPLDALRGSKDMIAMGRHISEGLKEGLESYDEQSQEGKAAESPPNPTA